MKVKESKKSNVRLFSEIKPGTLFKYGDDYFIKVDGFLYRKRQTITNVKVSCGDAFPECEFNEWDEPVEAICVQTGKAERFRQLELVEALPDAFISLEDSD